MKQSIFPSASYFVVLVLVSAVAFIAGRSTGTPPAVESAAKSVSGLTFGGLHQRPTESPAVDDARIPAGAPASLTADEAKARAFEVLSIPDRMERLQQLCELLGNVNSENWRSITDAFMGVATTTGRRNREELSLILERIGAVAGKEAIEEVLSSERSHERKRVPELLTGWALADPKEAMNWVSTKSAEQQAELIPALIDGMAQSDPIAALSVVSNDLSEIRDNLAPRIVGGIIQNGGFVAVEDLLSKLTGSPNIIPPVQGAVFWEVSVRQVEAARLRGDPLAVLDWAEHYVTGNFKGPASMKEIIACAAKGNASATIRWIEARQGKLSPEQEAVAFPIIAREMLVQDSGKLAEWVSSNPEHPHRDSVVRTVAEQLLKTGRIEEARQWVQTIADPGTRQTLEQEVLDADQKLGTAARMR